MTWYVVSDHHFGHENIIEYTDRPFGSVDEMDRVMLDRHHDTVGTDDVVFHLGDVAMNTAEGEETIEHARELDADLLVEGNHDVGLDPARVPFPVLDSCTMEYGGYSFLLTHDPGDIPDGRAKWSIHGHEHDNHPDEHPFIHYDEKRVNVSVELITDPWDSANLRRSWTIADLADVSGISTRRGTNSCEPVYRTLLLVPLEH